MNTKDRLRTLERTVKTRDDGPPTPLERALQDVSDDALRELIAIDTNTAVFADLPLAVRNAIIAERLDNGN